MRTLMLSLPLAWNGSVEASRAVGAAIPLLKMAETVKVLHVGEVPPGAPSADSLRAYFACHDVTADLVEVQAREGATGAALLEKTHDLNADLLVMGAYTRSRLRQMLLGGVTSYMLDNADLPVFMSH
jgi:nucleotide-binding universal stress UspA family protein